MTMFSTSLILIPAVLFSTVALAQPENGVQTADVSFFNATTGETRLYLDWSGQKAFPNGLAAGVSMGPLMIPAEEAAIEARSEGFLPVAESIRLTAGERVTLVFFAGPPEQSRGEEQPKPRLRVFQTKGIPAGEDPKEYAWPVIYVGPSESVQIEVNGEKVLLSRGKTTIVARGKNVVQLTQGDRELAAAAVEQPSNRLFVIYGSAEELRGGIVYQ